MKSVEIWPKGFRGEVILNCEGMNGWTSDDKQRMRSDHNSSS